MADDSLPCAGMEWCGGTLRGVQRKLDYIQNMGFDAIWITPVVKQVDWRDNYNGTSYHGYWAQDFFQIDPHLGTEEDLLALKKDCQSRNILLMVDVVANHVGPIHSIDQVKLLGDRLNSPSGSQFHQLNRLPGESFTSYMQHPAESMNAGASCWPNYRFGEDCNYTVVLEGWFGDLADLNQENPEIRDYLLQWISWMAKKYDIDGFRLDTALYIPKWFLSKFNEAAGTYMVGEVVTENMTLHSSYSSSLSGLLNFPVTQHLNYIFSNNGSMADLWTLLSQQQTAGYPSNYLLGNFIDNHDSDRFLFKHSGDVSPLKNALTWTMFYHGLPIVYYGTEQVEVSLHQDNRVSMWPHYNVTDIYRFLTSLNKLRKVYGLGAGGENSAQHAVLLSANKHLFSFIRGDLFVLLTNTYSTSPMSICLATGNLTSRWSDVCNVGVNVVLGGGGAPKPYCNQNEFCVQTQYGQPAVFARAGVMEELIV
eukprot:gnl/MRDRNA2_/MRDRNA2_179629_c0_seq1.p1 gnl/MRDRNA2_/MRDRNA2_179629_c0~~gnl/MRDRNA2_/MRDRNA2_179629_c0_seq1.p1  ORF type:complete len:520 (+),score=67.67 gnl/MRDRNA2_/MRDRNA2_179629_c0_seq1:126-1562(+)